ARREYALIGVIERVLRANGVRTDLETALFDIDHRIRLRNALGLARLAHTERPSIDGDDVLVWALLRNGRCSEALRYSKHSLLVIAALAATLLAPAAAQAHPLGNFTINHFARVEVAGHRLYVRYVLDVAEIPTYQARQQGVDPSAYARRLAAGLHLTLAGRAATLVPVSHALAFPNGVGGLHTMRLQLILRGPTVDGAT